MRTMSPDPPARLKAVRALSRVSVSPVINGRAGSLTHGLAPAAVKAPASSAALTATRWKAIAAPPVDRIRVRVRHGAKSATRSEEHTSELQSLMRNSYAVFCLKKIKD